MLFITGIMHHGCFKKFHMKTNLHELQEEKEREGKKTMKI